MLMLRLDAKSTTNQTYDQATMITVGRKFDLESASSPLFTGLVRGSRGDAAAGQHLERCQHLPHLERLQEFDCSPGHHGHF